MGHYLQVAGCFPLTYPGLWRSDAHFGVPSHWDQPKGDLDRWLRMLLGLAAVCIVANALQQPVAAQPLLWSGFPTAELSDRVMINKRGVLIYPRSIAL